MKFTRVLLALAVPATLMSANPALAKGCLRGAAAGVVAGHFAHHHALLGAMGGCAAGHIYYKHNAKVAQHPAKTGPRH